MRNSTKVGDIDIAWGEKGKGFPLLFISGFGTTMDIWEESTIDRLSEYYRVLIFDNRGIGGSAAGEKEFTIRRFADDARGLLEVLGIEKSHILGWSMGSLVAQEIALVYPECIEKLVLYASYADWRFPPAPEVIDRLSDQSGTPEERGMRWVETLFPSGWLSEHGQRVGEIFSRPLGEISGDSLIRQQKAIELWGGTAERLGSLKARTLLLCGDEDVLVPSENSEKMNKLIPGSKLQVVKGAGHGLMFQEPDVFVSLVMEFLDGTME
ncbi:MAG: alpha/beta hydrolase [Thermovirgaceae bacterium]|nr:alpha/beta hydrolase [Thermovirgaceae bacterium]